MKIIETFERIKLLHALILQKKTGTPDQLAKRLGISRTCLYNLIDELKGYNLPIDYSKSLTTFFYEQDVVFTFLFKIMLMN